MATGGPMAMPTDHSILTLAQWFSPGYPLGSFSYSHGLEWATHTGEVTNPTELMSWLEDVLRHGAGWSDALFLAAAYRADSTELVEDLDRQCRAFTPSKERALEADQQGGAFCRVTSETCGICLEGLTFPVAVGRAAALCALPLPLTAQMYLQAFAANLVAAAQRLAPIGQTKAQGVARALIPLCAETASAAIESDLSALSGTAFVADIASMQHETQYSRIFRS